MLSRGLKAVTGGSSRKLGSGETAKAKGKAPERPKASAGDEFVKVAPPNALQRDNERLHVTVHGRHVTLVTVRGEVHAIDSTCYHAGGPLGLGDIEDVQGEVCIVCPWHSYKITLGTGAKLYQALEMGPDKKLVPSGWKRKEMSQRVHQVQRRPDGLYVKLNTDGTWDSDEYGTTVGIKGDKQGASAGKDGSILGGYGSNKIQYSPGGSRGVGRPQRSGHVLNPPPLKTTPVPGSGAGAAGVSVTHGAPPVSAEDGTSPAAARASVRPVPEVIWTKVLVTSVTKEGDSGVRLRVSPLIKPSPTSKSKKPGVAGPLELLGATRALGVFGDPQGDSRVVEHVVTGSDKTMVEFLHQIVRTHHIQIRAFSVDEMVIRSYTPIESRFQIRRRIDALSKSSKVSSSDSFMFELAIKIYPNGAMSRSLSKLKVGASLDIAPGEDEYLERKIMKLHTAKFPTSKLFAAVLFAGGSGITPMFQLVQNFAQHSMIPVTLIYCCQTQKSLMLVNDLLELAGACKGRLKVQFVLSQKLSKAKRLLLQSSNGTTITNGVLGRFNKDMAKHMLPNVDKVPEGKVMFFSWCGPEGFNSNVKDSIATLGFNSHNSISLAYIG